MKVHNRMLNKTAVIIMVVMVLFSFMPSVAFAADDGNASTSASTESGDKTNVNGSTEPTQPEDPEQPGQDDEKNYALTTEHVKYISPDSLGKFYPSSKLTKAKAAQMIYNLLEEKPEGREYCKDVNAKTANGNAMAALMYLGVIEPDSKGYYYPTKNITKGQLESMLYKCLDKTGASTSTATISRGAAVRLINKALGRQNTDKSTILKGSRIRPFTDVPTSNTYYYDIMEASISHTPTLDSKGAESWSKYVTEKQGISGTGWKVIDGETYYIDKNDKVIKRNTTVNGSKLDKNGRYTTGNANLDKELTKGFKSQTKNSMTNKEKLKAVYTYVYKTCTYRSDIKRKASKNCTSWDKNVAYKMLKNKKGNCYYFAAAVTYAARKCGYDAKTISGYVTYNQNRYYMQHGWTEIKMSDGTKRFIDTELQYLSYKGGWGSDYFLRPYGTMNRMHHKHYYSNGGAEIKK